MQEIRFHGRGGQGAVIGSEVLAHAFFHEDKFVQAFPAFGVERRGAPVTAFCRIDNRQIHLRNQIYAPDHVIILDASLLTTVGVTQGLKSGGTVLVNGNRQPEYYRKMVAEKFEVYVVDASMVAVKHHLGTAQNPIVNTAILGAFAKATGLIGMAAIERAIDETVPLNRQDNRNAAREAYQQVVRA